MADATPWEKYAQVGQSSDAPPWEKYSTPEEKTDATKLSWSQVPLEAVKNIPSSGLNFLKNTMQPFIHPIDTAQNISRLGLGVAEKAGISPTSGHEQYADAAWKMLVDRYGGMDQLKKTIAEDPVGFVSDISIPLTAGGTALEDLPSITGRLGKVAKAAGETANPLTAVEKTAKVLPKAGTEVIGNMATGSGAAGIKGAFEAGKEGGPAGEAFRANMRQPEAHQTAIVTQARKALNDVRQERSVAYQKGMKAVGRRNEVLDFHDINEALTKTNRIKQFKGIDISPATKKVRERIAAAVTEWKKLDPVEYHTPAGLDALKQYVGDIKDSLQFGTPERKVAEEAYGAIRGTIIKQAPEYAKIMKDYEQASNLLDELTKTLSLGKKASEDTALRKLLSTTRSGVNTNFGKRADLAKELGKRDPTLVPSLAGQSLSTVAPQGLVGKGAAGLLGSGALYAHNPFMLAGLPLTSPRVVGEAAHGVGRAVGKLPDWLKSLVGKIDPQVLKQVLQQAQLDTRISGAGNAAQPEGQ